MSAFAAEAARSDDEVAAGQRHDRIAGTGGNASDDERGEIEITGAQKMLSAVSGSLLTSLLVTPLDVVRVRLQSQPNVSPAMKTPIPHTAPFSNLPNTLGVTSCCREVFWVNNNATFCVAGPANVDSLASGPECAVEEVQRRNFTSTLDGLRKIARNEGFTSLWRGLSPTLVMAIPANVIYFAGYDWLRHSRRSPIARYVPDGWAPLVAGSLARVSAATVISPVEMFRTRLQASGGSSQSGSLFSSTLRGLHEMVNHQGYGSLWRGLTLTLWRDVPFSGLYWWGYETVRNGLTDARARRQGQALDVHARSRSRSREHHTTTLTDSFVAGATSGAVAALLTTPFDVGKTRQQVLQHSGDRLPGAGLLRPEERSMPRFLWHIVTEEGAAGLWRGATARCLKVAPACAIMISSYEVGKKMARGMNERGESL
ncbi:MAG: hypothetical protein M1832_002390 [Thelocarpon impressellum]|nr:MAG: hypothetical protein M1832_002390 [Thelocarpon impressellum]